MRITKLSELTGFNKNVLSSNELLQVPIRSRISEVLSLAERIEANKNKEDLKPSVDFVKNNVDFYKSGFTSFLTKEDTHSPSQITFGGSGELVKKQIPEITISQIIASIPTALRKISDLKKVLYFDLVLVPYFKEDGNFDEIR